MNSKNRYKRIVREILEEINPYEEFNDQTNLIETGLIDSLAIVFLVTELEERHHIKIDEKIVIPQNFESINAISDLLESLKLG